MLILTSLSVLLTIRSSSFLFWLMFDNHVTSYYSLGILGACTAHILGNQEHKIRFWARFYLV